MHHRVLAVAVVLVASPTLGDEDQAVVKAKVKAAYESGITHYNLGEYKEALEDFKAAYRLRRDSAFLFNLGQCYRQLGEPSSAVREYRAYLREEPTATNRVEVEKRIADMEKAVVEQRARQPPTGTEPPHAEQAPQPAVVVVNEQPPPSTERPRSIASRPWFWVALVGAVAVVAAAVALGVVFGTTEHDPVPSLGTVRGN